MMTAELLKVAQLNRIKTAIRRNGGPIRWISARSAMSPGADRRDARFDNETIADFVTLGDLTRTWDDHGNVLVSYSF